MLDLSHAELGITFVGSEKMRRLNARYRGIDRPTDVLSFALLDSAPSGCRIPSFPGPLALGDIVICIPKAYVQAREYGVSFHEELLRLMIHGLLHLAGYDHERNSYQRKRMQAKEKELIEALQTVA